MADPAQIELVKENLPSWREEIVPDWDDAKISSMLDSHGNSMPKVVRQFWFQRVSDATALTDVIDAGASRPLSQLYQHAREMLSYWDKISGEGATASSVGKIKTRYPKHPIPPFTMDSYGGVYVRAD